MLELNHPPQLIVLLQRFTVAKQQWGNGRSGV